MTALGKRGEQQLRGVGGPALSPEGKADLGGQGGSDSDCQKDGYASGSESEGRKEAKRLAAARQRQLLEEGGKLPPPTAMQCVSGGE